jgi:hypothetical protein
MIQHEQRLQKPTRTGLRTWHACVDWPALLESRPGSDAGATESEITLKIFSAGLRAGSAFHREKEFSSAAKEISSFRRRGRDVPF